MPKTILNYHDQLDYVLYLIKTRQNNDVTYCISAVYAKNEIEIS